MTQKEVLTHALVLVGAPYRGNAEAMTAARASCVIEWLRDMNWHPEADAIEAKLASIADGNEAVMEVEENIARTIERDGIASFLNRLYGWGIETEGWKATKGAALVEELWGLITTLT